MVCFVVVLFVCFVVSSWGEGGRGLGYCFPGVMFFRLRFFSRVAKGLDRICYTPLIGLWSLVLGPKFRQKEARTRKALKL